MERVTLVPPLPRPPRVLCMCLLDCQLLRLAAFMILFAKIIGVRWVIFEFSSAIIALRSLENVFICWVCYLIGGFILF